MRDPRHDKLADVLVRFSTKVKRGDLVSIGGDPSAMPLIRATYEAVLKAGGHPIWIARSSELLESMVQFGQEDQLKHLPPLLMYESEHVDVRIHFISDLNTKAQSRVDPARLQMLAAARRPVMDLGMRRAAEGSMRWVGTMAPSHAAAQDAEMSLTEYEDFVFRAGLLHMDDPAAEWEKVRVRQQRLADWLGQRKSVRFRCAGPDGSHDTSKGATDLTVNVDGSTWINCFGDSNFPDGEVFAGPRGVDGVVHYNYPAVYSGREVEGVRLVFRGGRVVDASATKNEDYLIKMLDMDEGARVLGEIAIGTNYAIREFTKNTLFDEKIGGTFHAAVGAGYPESGSSNQSALHWDMVCDLRPCRLASGGASEGGEISADGEVFSRAGRFLKDGWPGSE